MYEDVVDQLRKAYDGSAAARDAGELDPWKLAEREAFLRRLQDEGLRRLLEIGAGPGHYGAYFKAAGLDVVCTDLSPEMVARCREKGLEAYAMDFLQLDFAPASFDAVFAINCLLHVPSADLPHVLEAVRTLLRPGGLFYYGVYGGYRWEGVWPGDSHEPKRFFVFYPDEELLAVVNPFFDVVDFHTVDHDRGDGSHFQSLVLRKARG